MVGSVHQTAAVPTLLHAHHLHVQVGLAAAVVAARSHHLHAHHLPLAVLHAQAVSVAALLVVHTAVASEAHITVAHLVVTLADISEDIIMLPHPHIITIITAHTFGAHSDPGVVPMLVVAVAVPLLLSVSFYSL